MLTLYLVPGSSSMAPHIALNEIGLPFETRPLSLFKRETRAPEFLAVNPEGKVPLLLIDGRPLTEVAAILLYLARRFPAANLLPAGDAEAEAQAVSWMSFCAATLHGALGLGRDRGTDVLRLADHRLGDRPWALGRYSIADIHLFRIYWRFAHALRPVPGSLPNLEAHHDRMMARPAVGRTLAVEEGLGYEMPEIPVDGWSGKS